MKNIILQTMRAAFLAIFLLFFIACPKPVSLITIPEDEGKKIDLGLDFDPIRDKAPKIQYRFIGAGDWLELGNEEYISITKEAGPDTPVLHLKVSNPDDFEDGSISWVYNDVSLSSAETFTVTTGSGAFSVPGNYRITVRGSIEGCYYDTNVVIIVVE